MKTKNTILLVIAFAFICTAAKAGEYHDDDKTALRNFLIQNSASPDYTNGNQLGLDDDYMAILNGTNWLTDESWVSEVDGLTWNEENPKRVTEIDWTLIYGVLAGSLDVSGCTALTYLDCSSGLGQHRLTNLNVSGCVSLTYLGCYGNQLTNLNVSSCTVLTDLYCYENQLTSLDVSGCTD